MGFVFALDKVPEDKECLTGGKASSLSRMIKAGRIEVPEGYVITSDSFEAGKIREEASGEIDRMVEDLDKRYTYAVRSSALNEDGEGASFAGQYETVTDVAKGDVRKAIEKVAISADSARVRGYTGEVGTDNEGIAVVVQRFVKPQFAGVIFTSDPMTGKAERLTGNYVKGEGELLVSGESNASEFTIGAFDLSYKGEDEFAPYAKKLGRYCSRIRDLYGMPMDIEWAVSEGRVYILQARPITTLRRLVPDTYEVNGTMNGYKLLTRTNVGEIFMRPVTPMTFSVLEKINDMLGVPDWLDCVCGQTYMNISVMCSMLVAFGRDKEKAFTDIKDLVGTVPEGFEVPVAPFDKKTMKRKVFKLFFPKEKSRLTRSQKHEMVRDLPSISQRMMEEIKKIGSASELFDYWNGRMLPSLNDGLASILAECGTSLVPLFGTRKKIAKISGEEMAERLCGGCVGVTDAMKPVLLIEDVISGKITREEYVRLCGHRCADEMELSAPRPYEKEGFPDDLIAQRKDSGTSLYDMAEKSRKDFEDALAEFKEKYPGKSRWIDREIAKFVHANSFREDIRSKGVWIFCVFREFILAAGRIHRLGDDIFMLYYKELFDLLEGDVSPLRKIGARKKNYEMYCSYPSFPTLIAGRFEPEKWIGDERRRGDFFCEDMQCESSDTDDAGAVVKGFPGARGTVRGTVRVIDDISRINEIEEGDVLVTVATNIGWTLAFPKVSAVVTDIGAPLSHAAIVAREFSIPAVVGCGDATTVLKTGDVVEVDGAKGTVKKISD